MPCIRLDRGEGARVGIFYEANAETEAELAKLTFGGKSAKGTRGAISYLLAERAEAFDLDQINKVGGVVRAISY